jgi:hypothetical protein
MQTTVLTCSQMIHSFLYLPDYPVGLMIAFQSKERMQKAGKIGCGFLL